MSDVSCRVIEGHLRYLEARGRSLEGLRRLLPIVEDGGRVIDETILRDVRQRVLWNTYVRIFEAAGPQRTDEEQEDFVVPSFKKVCVFTGYAQRLREAETRAHDLAAVFEKPIEPARLAAGLHEVLKRSSTTGA